jgi:hypothetical protein
LTEKVVVRIFPDGRIQAETKGIKGEKCTDLIPILEELLHADAIKAEYTEEFYEVEQSNIQQIQRNNL